MPRMLKYHGTPMGGTRADVRVALTGRSALVPKDRADDLAIVLDVCQFFILDNSAYSYWRKGFEEYPDYDGYVAWVRKLKVSPKFRGAFIPDHIAGDEKMNRALLARWPADLLEDGIPVFHMHHSLDYLLWLAQNYKTIALGGSSHYGNLKSAAWWQRIREMMDVLCDDAGRPLCQIHGLRMLDPKVFGVLPLTSGDSANAARNSCTPSPQGLSRGLRAKAIADRIEQHDAPATWTRPKYKQTSFSFF